MRLTFVVWKYTVNISRIFYFLCCIRCENNLVSLLEFLQSSHLNLRFSFLSYIVCILEPISRRRNGNHKKKDRKEKEERKMTASLSMARTDAAYGTSRKNSAGLHVSPEQTAS